MPVYMIRAGVSGPVKIGTANDVAKRLAELQVANSEPLILLRTFAGGAAEETRLHERFTDSHMRGEWHSFSDAMLGDVGLTEVFAGKKTDFRKLGRRLGPAPSRADLHMAAALIRREVSLTGEP